MKLRTAVFVLAFCCTAPSQNLTSWRYLKDNDPLHGKIHDKFVLDGKYLTPPPTLSPGFAPSLVILCYEGRVEKNYLSAGAVVAHNSDTGIFPVLIEGRLDGKKSDLIGDSLSADGQAVFFTRVDLRKLLKAHQAILGVNEYLGPEVVMQFDMPDSKAVFERCGRDRILKK